ncbi:hypothetical protein [Belliella pelovolcani]|uniref:hypothetical protein n=1 Tax=Belliella pelovolcani TaxID=529505 RepID=UPI00391D3685
MKLIYNLILFIISLFLFSCNKPNSQENETIIASKSENLETLNLSTYFADIKIIPLSNKVMIGEIERLVVDAKNNIYILDSHLSGTISKFNFKGDLVNYIRIENDSRFDLNGIMDMYFDYPYLNLNVLGNRIVKLDTNLNVIERINLPYNSNSHIKLRDKYLMFNNFLEDKILYDYYVYDDKKNKISNEFLKIDNDYPFHYKANTVFQSNNGFYFFSKAFNDTIYEIDEFLNLKPYITVDFGSYKIQKRSLEKISNAMEMIQFLRQPDFNTLMGEIHFVKDTVLISTVHSEGKTKNILINTYSKEATIFSQYKDDLISGAKFQNILYSDERYLVFSLSSELLYDQLVDTISNFKEDSNLTPNQNPYLFIIEK